MREDERQGGLVEGGHSLCLCKGRLFLEPSLLLGKRSKRRGRGTGVSGQGGRRRIQFPGCLDPPPGRGGGGAVSFYLFIHLSVLFLQPPPLPPFFFSLNTIARGHEMM